jgi:hypothetical protein
VPLTGRAGSNPASDTQLLAETTSGPERCDSPETSRFPQDSPSWLAFIARTSVTTHDDDGGR